MICDILEWTQNFGSFVDAVHAAPMQAVGTAKDCCPVTNDHAALALCKTDAHKLVKKEVSARATIKQW